MKKEIQKIVLGGVIFYNNKVLIVQRSKDETIYPNIWELPSGKKEFKESTEQALLREIKEETDLSPKIIIPFHTFDYTIEKEDSKIYTTQINYLMISDDNNVELSFEHQDYTWVEKKDLDQYDISKEIKEAILKGLDLINILS